MEPPPPQGLPQSARPCVQQLLVETPDWFFSVGHDTRDTVVMHEDTPLLRTAVRASSDEWSTCFRYRHWDGLSPAVVLSDSAPWPGLELRSVDVVARADAPEYQFSDFVDTEGRWVVRVRLRIVSGAEGVRAVEA